MTERKKALSSPPSHAQYGYDVLTTPVARVPGLES